jgi:hypothetical protein
MTDVLPPTYVNGCELAEEPHEHVAWARGRDEVAPPIKRPGGWPHERAHARAGQPRLGRWRGQW